VIEKCLQYFGLSEDDLPTLSKSDTFVTPLGHYQKDKDKGAPWNGTF
jgi:hypothetical protein